MPRNTEAKSAWTLVNSKRLEQAVASVKMVEILV